MGMMGGTTCMPDAGFDYNSLPVVACSRIVDRQHTGDYIDYFHTVGLVETELYPLADIWVHPSFVHAMSVICTPLNCENALPLTLSFSSLQQNITAMPCVHKV